MGYQRYNFVKMSNPTQYQHQIELNVKLSLKVFGVDQTQDLPL